MPPREFVTSYTFLAFAGFLLIIGIPCWIVGTIWPTNFSSSFLISLPIFPMTSDKRDYWTIGNSLNGQTIFPTSNFISIPFSLDGFIPKHKLTARFIHNLWGYDLNLTITQGTDILLEFHSSKNSIISTNTFTPQYSEIQSLLPNEMFKYSELLVHCPYPTLITKHHRIDHICRNDKYFCPIQGNFASISIGDLVPNNENYTLNIFSSQFVLNNFVETPQLYLGFWKHSNAKSLTLSGSILTSIGLLFLIGAIVIFFLYFMGTT